MKALYAILVLSLSWSHSLLALITYNVDYSCCWRRFTFASVKYLEGEKITHRHPDGEKVEETNITPCVFYPFLTSNNEECTQFSLQFTNKFLLLTHTYFTQIIWYPGCSYSGKKVFNIYGDFCILDTFGRLYWNLSGREIRWNAEDVAHTCNETLEVLRVIAKLTLNIIAAYLWLISIQA